MSETETIWLAIGFAGQAVFTARFLVQWAASEKKRDSVVPVAFWWLSLAGGAILLSYACYKRDPVIVVGQSMGVFIYVRNLMLVDKARRRRQKAAAPGEREWESDPAHGTMRRHKPSRATSDRAA